jgi:predicted nucleotidyltransferase
MDYDEQTITKAIDKAVRHTDEQAKPSFYAISGSHLYGFPSEDGGDIDIRGFHRVDNERHLLLDDPQEQYVINQGATTEGFEDYAHIDLVSYELKKFGQLLYQANFNVIEVVFCGSHVMNGVPLEMDALRTLVEDELPLDVPRSYLGMAKSNYYKYLNPNKETYQPTAKKYLYVLRGLLAAQYVTEEQTITADVRELAEWAGEDVAFVEDLISVKRANETAQIGDALASQADERIVTLFNRIDPPETVDKTDYKDRLNDWMLKVRT